MSQEKQNKQGNGAHPLPCAARAGVDSSVSPPHRAAPTEACAAPGDGWSLLCPERTFPPEKGGHHESAPAKEKVRNSQSLGG